MTDDKEFKGTFFVNPEDMTRAEIVFDIGYPGSTVVASKWVAPGQVLAYYDLHNKPRIDPLPHLALIGDKWVLVRSWKIPCRITPTGPAILEELAAPHRVEVIDMGDYYDPAGFDRHTFGASNSEARKRREERQAAAARPLEKDAFFFREDVGRTNDDAPSPAPPYDPVQCTYLGGSNSWPPAEKTSLWASFKRLLRALSSAGI